MASPQIPQGVLNRLRGSVTIPLFPSLNVTAPYLGEEGINMNPEGEATDTIPTMTGTVPSPAPYQMVTVEIALLKTQNLADLYKRQMQLNTFIGAFIIRGDSSTLSNYQIENASIITCAPGRLNGKSVPFIATLRGYWLTNASLYDAA